MTDQVKTYGFLTELVNPPTGGYPFIEWDDLDNTVRVAVAAERACRNGVKLSKITRRMRGTLVANLDDLANQNKAIPDLITLAAVIEDLVHEQEALLQDAMERINAAQKQGGPYLLAEPHEVVSILQAANGKDIGDIVPCNGALAAYTCVKGTHREVTGSLPGNVVTGITVTNAWQEFGDTGRKLQWMTRVVWK